MQQTHDDLDSGVRLWLPVTSASTRSKSHDPDGGVAADEGRSSPAGTRPSRSNVQRGRRTGRRLGQAASAVLQVRTHASRYGPPKPVYPLGHTTVEAA